MPDERVAAAIRNWAGRFIANGIDYNDFVATTGAIETWAQWLPAWTAVAEAHRERAERAAAAGQVRSAGEAHLLAAVSFHFSKFVWMLDPQLHRRNTQAAIRCLYAAHEHLDPTAERIEAAVDGLPVLANLRRPPGASGRVPLVVLIPGLDSTKEEFFVWETVFLARGMATLSVDGPGQGETGWRMHIRPDYETAVAAVLDAVDGRPELDMARVGTVGVSLGEHYVVRAAAFEPRIGALAGISRPFQFGAHWRDMPELTRETLIHQPGAASAEEARRRAQELDLEGVAQRVRRPCLVVTGRRDRVIPGRTPSGSRTPFPEPSGCSTTRARTSATTSPPATGRSSRTGCGAGSGDRRGAAPSRECPDVRSHRGRPDQTGERFAARSDGRALRGPPRQAQRGGGGGGAVEARTTSLVSSSTCTAPPAAEPSRSSSTRAATAPIS
jgi:dienelactone hydrolase